MRALVLTLAFGAAALAVTSSVMAAGDPSILGKDAPPIDTKEFIQSDGRTAVADFKGEVLFIECFATW